jgi:hypothetical protein
MGLLMQLLAQIESAIGSAHKNVPYTNLTETDMFRTSIEKIAITVRATFAATMAVAILSVATTASAQNNTTVGDLPHALICTKEGITVVGYLARVNANGSSVYMTPTNIIVAVSADGLVDNRSDGTCAGKSLDELRGSGQTRDFPE